MAAIVSPSDFRLFFTDLDTNYFWRAYNQVPVWYTRIASVIPLGTEQMLFGWMGRLDTMREWLGSRVERAPAPMTYLVVCQNWELTEALDRFKLADDTYGVYYPLIEGMGVSTRKNQDYRLRNLVKNLADQTGARQFGSDGLAGFATNHPVDLYDASKGTYYNDYRGGPSIGGVTVGGQLAPVSYQTVWADMASRVSESGEAQGVIPELLCTAPQLSFTAKTLLQAEFLSPKSAYGLTDNVGNVDNVAMRGSADYLMIPEFAGTRPTDWLLFDTKRPLKPLLWLERAAPMLIQRVSPTDPASFDRHALLYGAEARGTPAWGPAFLSSISGPA
jgi:phage major head subunit gpT-like protein